MANLNFHLRTKKGNTPQLIYASIHWHSDKLWVSTGLKACPNDWNAKKYRIRENALCSDKDIINARLDVLTAKVRAWITSQRATGVIPGKDDLRKYLEMTINPNSIELNTLHGFITNFINHCNKRTSNDGKIISHSTQNSYKLAYKYICEYEKFCNKTLKFTDLGLSFYENFTSFLQEKKLSVNYIGKIIRVIKIFLNDAKKKNIHLNNEYLNGAFKIKKENSDNIYLTKKELLDLYNLDLTNNKPLERVRDLFLIGCYTGLRFSDYSQLSFTNITNGMIKVRTRKTNELVEIPLHPIVSKILKKYGGILPKISLQKFNKYLSSVAKLCINGKEIKIITKGGARLNFTLERWQMVKSHTARRTFATNLYIDGYPSINIMKITGHKTETSFLKYIKVSSEMSAKMLQLHWKEKGEYLQIVNK